MRFRFLPLVLSAAGLLSNSCDRSPPHLAPAVKTVSTFAGAGVVRKVDAGQKKMVIAHEKIVGFMEAMTMEFDVADGGTAAVFAPGDTVAFRLFVTSERSWIDELRKTGHVAFAPHSPMLSGLLPPGAPLPDCPLVDQRGTPFRLGDFKGRALAFTFIFTRCPLPDFCPLMNRNLAAVQRELSADPSRADWHLLSISFDPEHDTPARLLDYARPYLGDGAQWTFATGEPADIQKLGEAFGLMVARNGEQIDHSLRTVVVDATGRVQKIFVGNGWQSAELLDEMRRAMNAKP